MNRRHRDLSRLRPVALLLAVCVVAGVLSGCSSDKAGERSTDAERTPTSSDLFGLDPDTPEGAALVDSFIGAELPAGDGYIETDVTVHLVDGLPTDTEPAPLLVGTELTATASGISYRRMDSSDGAPIFETVSGSKRTIVRTEGGDWLTSPADLTTAEEKLEPLRDDAGAAIRSATAAVEERDPESAPIGTPEGTRGIALFLTSELVSEQLLGPARVILDIPSGLKLGGATWIRWVQPDGRLAAERITMRSVPIRIGDSDVSPQDLSIDRVITSSDDNVLSRLDEFGIDGDVVNESVADRSNLHGRSAVRSLPAAVTALPMQGLVEAGVAFNLAALFGTVSLASLLTILAAVVLVAALAVILYHYAAAIEAECAGGGGFGCVGVTTAGVAAAAAGLIAGIGTATATDAATASTVIGGDPEDPCGEGWSPEDFVGEFIYHAVDQNVFDVLRTNGWRRAPKSGGSGLLWFTPNNIWELCAMVIKNMLALGEVPVAIFEIPIDTFLDWMANQLDHGCRDTIDDRNDGGGGGTEWIVKTKEPLALDPARSRRIKC